jgi:hypothetical protein
MDRIGGHGMSRRSRLSILGVAVVVIVASVAIAWQIRWPRSIFGSSSAAQSATQAPVKVGVTSATPYLVALDVYVNSLRAWRSLTSASRSSLLEKLHIKERQFRAAGSRVVPPVSSFTVHMASAISTPSAASHGSERVVLAARVSSGLEPGEADFGATAFGDRPLVAGTALYDHFTDLLGWTPCVSAPTSLPDTPTLDLCAGQIVGATGFVPQLGMTAALITASGVAANRAELPVTATYTNQSGHQAKVVVTGSAAFISVSLHAQFGVGCEPSRLLYATPTSGTLADTSSHALIDEVTGCLQTAGSAIPFMGAVPRVVKLLSKGRDWLSGFFDAYNNVTNKSQLAASPALQACASGQTVSDVLAIMADFGPVGTPTCDPHSLPAWTGTVAAGQSLQFTAAPVVQAYTFGDGSEITALFSFMHLHVTQCPATGPCQAGSSAPAQASTPPPPSSAPGPAPASLPPSSPSSPSPPPTTPSVPSAQCVLLEPDQTYCTSSDPSVILETENSGDTSDCTFSDQISWGDGSQQTVVLQGADNVPEVVANHTYAQPGAYGVTDNPTVVSGPCTAIVGNYTFAYVTN